MRVGVNMLKLEEYIEKRKLEDGINEFDNSQKMNNIRSCINYIFEYFDQYLPIQGAEKRTTAENEKIMKYEKTLRDYTSDIREWIIAIYDTYGKQTNRIIDNFVKKVDDFSFMYEESEFRSLSYDCYANLIKQYPFLKNQTEMLYKFIKEHHIKETNTHAPFIPDISPKISKWLQDTLHLYNVNIFMGLDYYLKIFDDNQEAWPAKTRIKLEYPILDKKYRYNYQRKTNLFNVDILYARLAHKPFIKGRKKQLEILMMYIWLHSYEGDEDYWNEYLLQQEDY